MKRCVVRFKDGYCNIEADMICREEGILLVYKGTELVGVFDLGCIDVIYLTEKKGDGEA